MLRLSEANLQRQSKLWSLSYGSRQTARIYHFLYDGATIYLLRKKAVDIELEYREGLRI